MREVDDNGVPVARGFHADSRGGGDWSSLLTPQDNNLPTDEILTKAETRIASGYTCGMIGKEIADAAGISHNTVIRHTQNIYEKAGIPHSTNSLVAWFLAKNFNIDLSEFRRRVGAVCLLAILCIQMYETDFGDSFIRATARRSEARKGRSRRRKEEDDTYYLY